MKISIITVCYNSQDTIRDTLESVLSQTYENYEYLIIDGKSTDSTLNIIKEYEKKFDGKLKYVSEKDNGLYDAMNKGIKMASGDIIGIINSDDILAHKNVFRKVIDKIKDNDGVYSNLLMLDENLEKTYRLFKSKKMSKKLGWHPPHPTLYIKKEVYGKYGYFDINYKIAADLDFMLRIINNDVKLKYINDYFVYMRAGGASTNGLKGYYKNFKESYDVLKKNNVKFPFITNIKRTINVYIQKLKIKNKKEISRATNISLKPKLIQINTVCNGSTGKIMGDIQRKANEEGFETLSIYGRRKGYEDLRCIKVGGFFSFWFHVFLTTVFDKQGHGSYFKTKKIIKLLKNENPDIIHLHNIHGYYLNYKLLFKYLKNEYIGKIFWTFHDCWPFTGHCPHFTEIMCDKWKSQCYKCPNKKKYPISLFLDSSNIEYKNKKKHFTSVDNLNIIVPSDWLKNLVKQSYMKNYNITTINNWINSDVYKPTYDTSILEKYNIKNDKKIILGVASIWDERKGLNVFQELAKKINKNYNIVLVGLTKKQINKLPQNIIGIQRTENQKELAVLYTRANLFLNPSKEETFSLVTLEAIFCGTPVIVLNTSAVKELVDKDTGIILEKFDLRDYLDAINSIKIENISNEKIIKLNKNYDLEDQINKILYLYKK